VHTSLQIASGFQKVFDYIIKLCRTQAEVILNYVNPNVSGIVQEARYRKYRRLTLGIGQAYNHSAD
jgi:hypothetical protein